MLLSLGTLAVLAAGAFILVGLMIRNGDRIADAQARRFLSYQLADEVRQSSDDLTRMARTFVVTGDPRFEEYFDRILAIREGREPRPVGYHGIYWDFVAATGERPRPDGEPIALESLMRELGFTADEFALLDRAKDLSEDLVTLEEQAMHAVKGLFPDSTGAYSIRGEPDPALARRLLHGADYHRAKASIMAPVDEFVSRIDERTAAEIGALRRSGGRLGILAAAIIGLGALLLVVNLILWRRADVVSSIGSEEVDPAVARPKTGVGVRSAWPLLMAASAVVLAVILLAWWNQVRLEEQIRSDTENALTTVLEATTGSVQQWFREREQEARVWAGHIDVREHARVLAEASEGVPTAQTAAAQAGLQTQLDEFALGMGYQGYLVMSTGNRVLASHDPALILPGTRDIVRDEFLSEVVSAPRYGSIELPHTVSLGADERGEPVMMIGAAIREDDGEVIAALVLLIDPQETFTRILQRGRIGESGESYAFNRAGQLISESRFDDQLRDIRLISEHERAILNIQIRDPGGNLTEGFQPLVPRSELPLTHMAERAIASGPGANLDGYNDYRGVPVVGAWTWDETDGLGITTEMDVAEAYRSVLRTRRSALLASVASVFLVLALIGLFLRSRKRMAEAQAELERVVASLRDANDELENVNSVILRWDPEGRVIFLNDFGFQLFGFPRDDIVGQPLLGTIVPEEESTGRSLSRMIDEILTSPEKFDSNENENLTKDGNRVWMAWRNKPIVNEDGTLKEILTIGIDITERRAAEQRFRSVTESASDAIILSDSSSKIVGWNPAAAEMFGWGEEEIIGQPVETIIPDRFRKQHKAGMDRLTTTGESRVIGNTVEVVGLHRGGKEFPIELSLSMWSHGPNRYYSGMVRDITVRKRMEAELEKARLRMEDELNVGREIQMSMLPLIFPAFPRRGEFDVYALLEPAREVGGDFYDFFLIDDDNYCMCVGDVSGKGVPAALFMAVTKTLIKSRASNDFAPSSILTHVNNEISRNNDASMFVTIFLAFLDLNTGELRYSNAGHNPPYVRRADGELARLDQRHGPVIGALEGMVFAQDSVKLAAGDLLFAYTDGVTEAMDEEQNLYDEHRLVKVLSSLESSSAEESAKASLADVREFQGQAEQADDITIIATTYYGSPEGAEARVLDLSLANRLEEIARANSAFSEFAEVEGVAASVRRSVNLVLDELLSNVISYAFADDARHEIEVGFELSSDRLSLTISDDGIPFNPFAGSPPDTGLSMEEREIGGLGIHLVRKMMDEVSYNRRTDRNVVILVKYLDDQSDN
jgi:sigma-B regulation protein RsbU (phosphoserine phosphatase)